MLQARPILCVSVVLLLGTSVPAQQPPETVSQRRSRELKGVLDSMAGTSTEKPRIFKLPDGCIRFLMAPPGTHFPGEPAVGGTPEQVASRFLQAHRLLFVDDSAGVGFQVIQVIRGEPRAHVRYGQRYRGMEVFGAQMLIAVDSSGGIVSVTSDIMCHTEWLDTGKVAFTPSLDSAAASKKAVEFLSRRYPKLEFDAGRPELKVFSPGVVGLPGTPRLVWQATVVDKNERHVKELILIDAHTGDILFYYSLWPNAKYRRIHDWSGTTTTLDPNVRIEGQGTYGVADVDNAYDYLEDAYDFYNQTGIGRDSWNGAGADLIAEVRYGATGAWWVTNHIRVAQSELTDDTIGHEFTHGVFDTNVPGISRSGETGAIEESFCDMFGEWIDQTNGAGNDSSGVAWYMFEDWASNPWPWRRMDDPTACETSSTYGNDFGNLAQPDRLYGPGWYWDANDSGGVHHNLGVGSKLGYLLTQTQGVTFNGYSVTGLGITKAADLFYECLTCQLTATCDYYDLGNALQAAAATQSVGLTSSERTEVEEACRAVEIVPALMGCWDLDEGTGTTAGDSTSYNRDCVFGGDPAWVAGISGLSSDYALEFDGNDDAHRDALPALCGGAVTISAWIKPSSGLASNEAYAIATQVTQDGYGYWLGISSDNRKPSFWVGFDEVRATTSVAANCWCYVVGTYDGQHLRIYVNGSETDNANVQGERGRAAEFYIGHAADGGSNDFLGVIDQVEVYNYARSSDEIISSMIQNSPKLFAVKDSSGVTRAAFDALGNLILDGTLTQYTTPGTPGTGDFALRTYGSSNYPAIIFGSTGNMRIEGGLYEQQSSLSPPSWSFCVWPSSGSMVAYIDPSGDVYLKGKLYEQ